MSAHVASPTLPRGHPRAHWPLDAASTAGPFAIHQAVAPRTTLHNHGNRSSACPVRCAVRQRGGQVRTPAACVLSTYYVPGLANLTEKHAFFSRALAVRPDPPPRLTTTVPPRITRAIDLRRAAGTTATLLCPGSSLANHPSRPRGLAAQLQLRGLAATTPLALHHHHHLRVPSVSSVFPPCPPCHSVPSPLRRGGERLGDRIAVYTGVHRQPMHRLTHCAHGRRHVAQDGQCPRATREGAWR